MSVVEMAVEKVRALDEARARKLIAWLDTQESPTGAGLPLGAAAMLGFARRFRPEPRTTDEWMSELRAGESD